MDDRPAAEGGPGIQLRQARIARGVTLDEAAKTTRIGKNYLEALEAERYDRLPNSAYVRGFIRSYAGYLGIAATPLVTQYDTLLSPPTPPPTTVSPDPGFRRHRPPLLPLAGGAGVLIIAALLFFPRPETEQTGIPAAVSAPQPVPSPPETSPAAVPSPVTAPAATSSEVAATPPVPPAEPGDKVLRIKVNEETNLSVGIDGSMVNEYQLKPGDVIEWKGEKVFVLDLSNPAGVEAELGGKALPPLGRKGAPVRVEIGTDGKIH